MNNDVIEDEEITLFTDDENVVLDTIDFEFEQVNKFRGFYRKLSIFNGFQCYHSVKNKPRRKYKFRIDLAYINHHPKRERQIVWNWLYASIALLAVSAGLIYAGWVARWFDPGVISTIALVGLITALVICVLLFIHFSQDKVVFSTQYGQVKIIELLNQYPDKASFRAFISMFIKQIKNAKGAKNFAQNKFLARELKELRRLKEEMVISEDAYENAKLLIFKHDGFKSS